MQVITKVVFHLFFSNICSKRDTPVNIQQESLKCRAETIISLHVKRPLLLSRLI
jgi:hypothetical protein